MRARPAPDTRATPRRGTGASLLGSAFVAAIAYVDPGNFATNFSAGSRFGYTLLWVIVAANLMAMLVQGLSAKLGLATGRHLAQLCRDTMPRPVVRGLWVQAELVAVATDLAEIIGGALALNLLFGLPLIQGGLVTATVAFVLLLGQTRERRRFELVIAGLFGVILLGFGLSLLGIRPDGTDLASGLVPQFDGSESVLLATGIVGATVMPHVVYLHSAMTGGAIQGRTRPEGGGPASRTPQGLRRLMRKQWKAIFVAMGLAGLINAAMLVIAGASLHGGVGAVEDTLEGVHSALLAGPGQATALFFAVALLASGFASSSVGTYAGQVVMEGFLHRTVPLALRRALTLVPALLLLAFGVDPTYALVLSQVVLSFGIPFALVPLLMLTARRDLMGTLVNRATTTAAAVVVVAIVISLNVFLLVRTFS